MISNPPPWPHGARCAAAFSFDIDVDSLLHLLYPDDASRHMAYMSWSKYDLVGVTRILDIYRRHGLKQTFYIPAWCAQQYPRLVEQILEAGHELALHGFIHEEARSLSREDERFWLEYALDTFETVTGQRPTGWRAPFYAFSDYTAELLAEKGFLYDSSLMGDDVPYLLRTVAGDIVELPVEWATDDWVQFVAAPDVDWSMQTRSPDAGMAVFEAELEAAHLYGGLWVAVWHPMVSGRLSRAIRLERLIEKMLSWGDVWIAPLGDIARHIQTCAADGSYQPRIDTLPYYPEPVPGLRRDVVEARVREEERSSGG